MFLIQSCSMQSANLSSESSVQETLLQNTGTLAVQELDFTEGAQYIGLQETSPFVIRKRTYPAYDNINYWEEFNVRDMKNEYYKYDGEALTLIGSSLFEKGIQDSYLSPVHLQSRNGTYYYVNGYLVREDAEEMIGTYSSSTKSIIQPTNESKTWILFNCSDSSEDEYVLYNLDTKEEYTFSYEHPILYFYSFNNVLVFGWDVPETDPWNIQYSVYKLMTSDQTVELTSEVGKAYSNENDENSNRVALSELTSCIALENYIDTDVSTSLFEFTTVDMLSPKVDIISQLTAIGPEPGCSVLVWTTLDKTQIYYSDWGIPLQQGEEEAKSPPKTLLSDTIISQIHPFHTKTTQGFWVIPALTTIGDDSTIYLFTWENNGIQKHEYHIHPCFFEKNTFIGEQGELYIISTDYSSSTPVYQLHILNPANAVAYQTYTLETTSPLLQQNVSSMYFTKLFMNNNQILLEATANSHYHHKNEQLSGLYRIMLTD